VTFVKTETVAEWNRIYFGFHSNADTQILNRKLTVTLLFEVDNWTIGSGAESVVFRAARVPASLVSALAEQSFEKLVVLDSDTEYTRPCWQKKVSSLLAVSLQQLLNGPSCFVNRMNDGSFRKAW